MMKSLNTDYDDDGQFLEIHDYFHFDLFLRLIPWRVKRFTKQACQEM